MMNGWELGQELWIAEPVLSEQALARVGCLTGASEIETVQYTWLWEKWA